MDKTAWIRREIKACKKLGLKNYEQAIKKMAEAGHYGQHHYYTPGELNLQMLLKIAEKIGIPLQDSPDYGGKKFNTKSGILICDLQKIMAPWPSCFNRGYGAQLAFIREQGGNDLTSAEEVVYLLIHMFLKFGKILFEEKTGYIRCRNLHNVGSRSVVSYNPETGLGVGWYEDSERSHTLGVVLAKFVSVVA